MFAVSSIIHGLLPPSSKTTGVRYEAAACITVRPTAGLPVKKIMSYFWSRRASFSFLPPSTTRTCPGSKTSSHIFAITDDVAGEYAEGLTITQFPAVNAAISGVIVSING
jgi:hypothetical protein